LVDHQVGVTYVINSLTNEMFGRMVINTGLQYVPDEDGALPSVGVAPSEETIVKLLQVLHQCANVVPRPQVPGCSLSRISNETLADRSNVTLVPETELDFHQAVLTSGAGVRRVTARGLVVWRVPVTLPLSTAGQKKLFYQGPIADVPATINAGEEPAKGVRKGKGKGKGGKAKGGANGNGKGHVVEMEF
jgi:hypothetical protein